MASSSILAFIFVSVFSVSCDTADPSHTIDALAAEDVCTGSSDRTCALNELQSGAMASKKSVKAQLPVAFEDQARSNVNDKWGNCAIVRGRSNEAPLPMTPGTQQTTGLADYDDIDLSGVWWLRWTKLDDSQYFVTWLAKYIYNCLELGSILFSFDHSVASGTGGYPMNLTMPVGLRHQWAYGTTWFAKIFQVMQTKTTDTWVFSNSTYAFSPAPNYYGLEYIGKDEWLRPTYLNGGNVPISYVMTRIVNGDGSKTSFWKTWEKEGPSHIRVWNLDGGACPAGSSTCPTASKEDECKRIVTSWSQVFFMPLCLACWWADMVCWLA